MDEDKFNELLDIVRKLKSTNSPPNEINDVIQSMTGYDQLLPDQLARLDFELRKKQIPSDTSISNYNMETDYF